MEATYQSFEELPIEIIKAIIEFVPEYGYGVNHELHDAAMLCQCSIYADVKRHAIIALKDDYSTPLLMNYEYARKILLVSKRGKPTRELFLTEIFDERGERYWAETYKIGDTPSIRTFMNTNDFEPWCMAIKIIKNMRPKLLIDGILIHDHPIDPLLVAYPDIRSDALVLMLREWISMIRVGPVPPAGPMKILTSLYSTFVVVVLGMDKSDESRKVIIDNFMEHNMFIRKAFNRAGAYVNESRWKIFVDEYRGDVDGDSEEEYSDEDSEE